MIDDWSGYSKTEFSMLLPFNHDSADPPKITEHPKDQSVATGADATFRVEATGDNLQFQWQKDERNIVDYDSRFKVSKTEDTSTLCIHCVQKSDKGHYRCLIKNPVEKRGMLSTEANLSVCKSVILQCI